MSRAIVWFRRDLRVDDHPALIAATGEAGEVVALFVLDPALADGAGANRLTFLYRSLRALDEQLEGRLVVRTGAPGEVVARLTHELDASAVYVTGDYGVYGARRDSQVDDALRRRAGIDGLSEVGSPYAVAPGTVFTKAGNRYQVFTPFYRSWKRVRVDRPAPPPNAVTWAAGIRSDPIPPDVDGHSPGLPPSGFAAANARLDEALATVASYERRRNVVGMDATTRLSPYLKYGTLHPRQVLAGLGGSAGAERLRTELAWREFYADVLWHRPDSAWLPLKPAAGAIRVDVGDDAERRFTAWSSGQTGYPIVDAGMRQLRHEGWMHNRVRMVAASFLVKDLHLAWQRGARHFLDLLVDGDVASNNHGWQWVAGTGTDPAPYARVFNPVLQGERFDPGGRYVRRWVPEVASLPDALVHRPWEAGPDRLTDYPAPIVDHAVERLEAIDRYAAARASHRDSQAFESST